MLKLMPEEFNWIEVGRLWRSLPPDDVVQSLKSFDRPARILQFANKIGNKAFRA